MYLQYSTPITLHLIITSTEFYFCSSNFVTKSLVFWLTFLIPCSNNGKTKPVCRKFNKELVHKNSWFRPNRPSLYHLRHHFRGDKTVKQQPIVVKSLDFVLLLLIVSSMIRAQRIQ